MDSLPRPVYIIEFGSDTLEGIRGIGLNTHNLE